jgi:hypothetical protein
VTVVLLLLLMVIVAVVVVVVVVLLPLRVLLVVMRPQCLLLVVVLMRLLQRWAATVVVGVPTVAVAHARRIPGAWIHGCEEDSDLLRNQLEDAGSKEDLQIGSGKRIWEVESRRLAPGSGPISNPCLPFWQDSWVEEERRKGSLAGSSKP